MKQRSSPKTAGMASGDVAETSEAQPSYTQAVPAAAPGDVPRERRAWYHESEWAADWQRIGHLASHNVWA